MAKHKKIHWLMMQKMPQTQAQSGFMLVEILVGVLLTLFLTAIAMQVVVMATSVKVRGDEVTDATLWIQQDLEDVKVKANAIDYNSGTTKYTYNSSRCNATSTTAGYAAILQGEASVNGSTIGSATAITKTSSGGNRTYSLVRSTTVRNASPFNVLQLTYNVYRGSATTSSPLTTLYAEVIPGASFYCG